ncbi:nucleolar protein 10 [Loa loa]|uniref:Nucleolar protein 10 n=1 Tax=Loa loa TaxID=7209 RepID=A0A1I7W0I6_LOALO|nr:nucleolar protein 10 [Loa loa]EFO25550.2 nucleolar protein 10 [Loa loa]
MQILSANDVKIYNLSAGKSIPDWITDRKRRRLEQKDIDLRRRIQLIQDFDMPDISNTVTVSPDGRYIFSTGTYRPLLKCFDVTDLSLKFSRGLDADVVKMAVLSDDYSKFVLLEEERYVEMHVAYGRYFRMRIPKFGHDMAFCHEVSDLYIVGSGSEIFRLNLEEGKFLAPLKTSSSSLTCCEFNRNHHLFICGTNDGRIEAWDHRDGDRCGILDCALHFRTNNSELPVVTSVCFKDALHLGVGTSTGCVLLFDIRSNKPLLIKDHQTGLPVNKIDFVPEHNLVLSMDMRLLKIWEETDGKPFAAIEPGSNLSDFCRYPDSGLLFFANEAPKMLQYFVPAIGTAPKWCSYLETVTEELEETEQPAVYDDYKFVTKGQLEEIGLLHLIGTSLLRAYMHGYFIDIRLYNKAKTFTQPLAYENYKQRKIMEKIDEERSLPTASRKLRKAKLPSVNKELAAKLLALMEEVKNVDGKTKKKDKDAASILLDERFGSLFTNPDFQVDESSEQFQLLLSIMKKLGGERQKLSKKDVDNANDNKSEMQSTEDLDIDESTSSASSKSNEIFVETDDKSDAKNNTVKKPYMFNDKESSDDEEMQSAVLGKWETVKPKGFDLIESDIGEDTLQYLKQKKAGENAVPFFAQAKAETMNMKRKDSSKDVGRSEQCIPFGGLQMTFKMKTCALAAKKEYLARRGKQHLLERREVRRSIRGITKMLKKPPVWVGCRRKNP